MYVKLGATRRGVIGTNAFADGSATNADSTPTCVVLDQGSAMGYAPTVTNKATGLYEVALVATSGNGFVVGHEYSLYVVVVVGGKTTRSPVEGLSSFKVTARDPDDHAYPATSGRSMATDGSGVSDANVKSYASGQAPGGQLKPNSLVDNYTYDGSKNPLTWRVRLFASKAATDAAVAAHADNADGEVERYKVTATYNVDGTLATYKVDRDL